MILFLFVSEEDFPDVQGVRNNETLLLGVRIEGALSISQVRIDLSESSSLAPTGKTVRAGSLSPLMGV